MAELTDTSHSNSIAFTLQSEGFCIAIVAMLAYAHFDGGWLMFALLILLPDAAMLGYLAGKRAGAICYNLAHSYTGPILLGLFSQYAAQPTLTQLSLIWLAHIGFDRAIGYGLKYATRFKDTHLNRV